MFEIDGDALRSAREARFLSQEELAKLADVTQSTVSRLELGMQSARGSTVRKFAAALDIDPSTILVKTEER